MIENTLKISQDWIEAIASESVKSKQICYQSLQEVVQVTLAIFPVYIHEPGEQWDLSSHFLQKVMKWLYPWPHIVIDIFLKIV